MSGKKGKVRRVFKTLQMSVSGQPPMPSAKPRKGPLRHVKFKKLDHFSGVNLAQAAKGMARPMRWNTVKSGFSTRMRGSDFLTAITIGGTAAAAGDVLYTSVVNPSALGVGRLNTLARLYERYKFHSLKFRYAPVANAQVTGQLIGYVDYDTMDDPSGTTGAQNLQRAGAAYGEKPVQVWQGSVDPVFWEIKDDKLMTDLYCESDGTDPRLTNQGRFVLLAASAIASGVPCGNIYLDYDIEFVVPQLDNSTQNGYGFKQSGGGTLNAANPFGTVRAPESWSNLLVTCTSTVMSLPAGSYSVSAKLVGTGITTFNLTSSGTNVVTISGGTYAVSSTNGVGWIQCYSSVPFTLTPSVTATTVTESTWCVSLLPANAFSLSAKRMQTLARLRRQVDQLCSLVEMKEEKAEASQSTSSATSSSMQSVATQATSPPINLADILSGKTKVDEGYCLVKKS
jgi:hypothetical protein